MLVPNGDIGEVAVQPLLRHDDIDAFVPVDRRQEQRGGSSDDRDRRNDEQISDVVMTAG
jgi:hypothetical protein